MTVSPETLRAATSGAAEYTVVLDSEPTDTVTVEPMASSDSDLSVSPDSLTFAPADWVTPRMATTVVSALEIQQRWCNESPCSAALLPPRMAASGCNAEARNRQATNPLIC
ncbi:hypothetical protein [Candidatus Palauibacter sp.]|uniref:hypothetical protein n=1 Tax=Candidatus Palauibacter sp. TaxID=3101350 RepID=UPI003B5B877E